MKIYFAGSIRGGRDDTDMYFELIDHLNRYGEVVTEHVGKKELTSLGEEGVTDEEIHNRDLEWLLNADVVIADVTTPSLGVGYEIGRAIEHKKPTLCLYHPQEGKKLSAMINGCQKITTKEYTSLDEAKKHVDAFFDAQNTFSSRLKKAFCNLVTWACTGLVSFHLGTQLVYLGQTAQYELFPTPVRHAFKEEFGFSIQGYTKEIEDGENVATIAAIIDKERREKSFSLAEMRIRSDNYFTKSIDQQWDFLTSTGNSGLFLYDRIVLDNFVYRSTVHHEIKHAKAAQIRDNDPAFEKKWIALACDKEGKSLYLTQWEDFCYLYKGLQTFVRKQDTTEDEQLGFVSSYARRNRDEDIAELCEEAECNENKFIKWLYTEPNQSIIAKTKLAQEYGLIPSHFIDYVSLLQAYQSCLRRDGISIDLSKTDLFMGQSQIFLERYPQSLFEGILRQHRGSIMEGESYKQAIAEYKKGLAASYKDPLVYCTLLESIANCASYLGDMKMNALYAHALGHYQKKHATHNVHLTSRGVNDYLMNRGEKL